MGLSVLLPLNMRCFNLVQFERYSVATLAGKVKHLYAAARLASAGASDPASRGCAGVDEWIRIGAGALVL